MPVSGVRTPALTNLLQLKGPGRTIATPSLRRIAMGQDLLEVVKDGVAVPTLNRPDRLNALSEPMLDTLLEALPRLAEDPVVGVVVLTGAGRGFCAGGEGKARAGGGGVGGARVRGS